MSFEVSVTVDDCNLREKAFSLITPFGNVEINLDFICSCQCEKEAKTVSIVKSVQDAKVVTFFDEVR